MYIDCMYIPILFDNRLIESDRLFKLQCTQQSMANDNGAHDLLNLLMSQIIHLRRRWCSWTPGKNGENIIELPT